MNTLETNKLIAKFMQLKQIRTDTDSEIKYLIEDMPHIHSSCYLTFEHLQYHQSWDWLMKVVNKIDSMGYMVDICNKQCRIYDKDLDGVERKRLFPSIADSNFEATYQTVTKFIKSYYEN